MITFLLLPFFLASRLSVDVDPWVYGPEYTYRVHVNMTARDGEARDESRAYDITSMLKCRPQAPDTLNCRFSSVTMGFFEAGLADLGQDTLGDFEIDEEPFEVKFDKAGVTGLVVTDSMSAWTLDMIRAIVNQLNLGYDFTKAKKSDDNFFHVESERSFLGVCESWILVNRKPMDDTEMWKQEAVFEIVPLVGFVKAPGEEIKIERSRNLEKCAHKSDYFFGSKQGYGILPQESTITTTSSGGCITISDNSFSSFTTSQIVMNKKSKNVTLNEKISLRLDSVNFAKTDIPSIPNPSFVSFFVHN